MDPSLQAAEEVDGEERAGESDKSEPKLLLQTVTSPALKKIHEKLSQPCCGIHFQVSGCRMSSHVPVLSEGAVGAAGPFGGMLLHSHLCSCGGFFCLWECCLLADLPLQGQAAFHYGFLSELMH